ncbi:MAG: PEP-CTERM sorting domain-containing protein [Candidatus Loosdrechtia sp.]|uniref:PEP-CTERM sorting domain-containing protein n=1 Tax=Candidatus Loosdrechtia sp. TaxID=3101272 RepID=UPI003A6D1A1A|nr:MAG: PEP-CTERM sorting domain-containing protein [Candidatus Jettenia sp. AMX2]
MKRKNVLLFSVPLLLSLFVATEVFAFGSSKGKTRDRSGSTNSSRPGTAPEPVSSALLLAGGATLAAIRRWKKRGLKETGNQLTGESNTGANVS